MITGVWQVESRTEQFKQRHRELLQGTMPEVAEAFMQGIRDRFLAEGDGEWRELARFTQEERQRLGFGPAHPILRRLEILFGALSQGNPGNVFEQDGTTMTVGIGGDAMHPGYEKGDRPIPIRDIATFHQHGTSHMVARPIFVPPSAETLEKMAMTIIQRLSTLAAG